MKDDGSLKSGDESREQETESSKIFNRLPGGRMREKKGHVWLRFCPGQLDKRWKGTQVGGGKRRDDGIGLGLGECESISEVTGQSHGR